MLPVVTSVKVTLTLGSATTSVEVKSDEVEALKTDSGELSDTLSLAEVNNLPISDLESVSTGGDAARCDDGDGRQLHERLWILGER